MSFTIDKTAALNQIAGDSFYNALIEKEKERIDILTSEYDELCQVFNESVSNGMVVEGSEAWQGMKSGIDSVAESIRDAEVQILKYENSIKEIAKLKFDDLTKQFDNVINVISSDLSKIEKETSIVEESGAIAGESFYQALIDTGTANLEALEKKHKSLSDSLKEALDNGSVKEYDDTWFEMTDSIKFDGIAEQFDTALSLISYQIDEIELKMQIAQESGYIAGESFYKALISAETTGTASTSSLIRMIPIIRVN